MFRLAFAVFLKLKSVFSDRFRGRSSEHRTAPLDGVPRNEVMTPLVGYASTDELLNGIRALLVPARDAKRELSIIDIHGLAFAYKDKLPGLGFRYGSALPYSERLEDFIHILYSTGELEISRQNPCKILVTEKLQPTQTEFVRR